MLILRCRRRCGNGSRSIIAVARIASPYLVAESNGPALRTVRASSNSAVKWLFSRRRFAQNGSTTIRLRNRAGTAMNWNELCHRQSMSKSTKPSTASRATPSQARCWLRSVPQHHRGSHEADDGRRIDPCHSRGSHVQSLAWQIHSWGDQAAGGNGLV
jgi:hypothetical protein